MPRVGMANTNAITVTQTLKYAANKASASLSTSYSADQTGTFFESGVQSVGTVDETLAKGDVGTIGWMAVRNQDTTNYVDVGPDGTTYPTRLFPGQGISGPYNGSAVHVKANTASCNVEYLVVEK